MSERCKSSALTRRDFLKLSGLGAAAVAFAGAHASGRLRSGLAWAPTEIASWLPDRRQGFPARILAAGGRLLAVEPNPAHPLAHWFDADAAQALVSDPYPSNLASGPTLSYTIAPGVRRVGASFHPLGWTAAVRALGKILQVYPASEVAFIVGEFPDHLHDLTRILADALGGASVLRLNRSALLNGQTALQDAAWQVFGLARLPLFDLPHAGLVYAFGVQGEEPWLVSAGNSSSPWVMFDVAAPTGGQEWVRIHPGGHAHAAQALVDGVARVRAGASDAHLSRDLAGAAEVCGVELRRLVELCRRFASSAHPLAVPGARALAGAEGTFAGRMILALNTASGNLGAPGGVFLPLDAPLRPDLETRVATLDELAALVERARAGQVRVLLTHGVDLLGEYACLLPQSLDLPAALEKLDHLVSFDAGFNETGHFASMTLPGLLPLETVGYQYALIGVDRPVVAALQPALPPGAARRSPGDVLLAAARLAGLSLPYRSEADFLHKSMRRLPWPHGADPAWRWQSQGGWWPAGPARLPAVCVLPDFK